MSRYASPPHPLPRNPIGWFAVGLSHELMNGDVREVSALGRELALFRNSNGVVGLLDAYCPHIGTHLGVGGVVDGESLRCPFHRWAFAPDGTCTDIPYAKKIPPAAHAGSYIVRERNGAILAWFHPDGSAPTWEVPEFEQGSFTSPYWVDLFYDVHIQELAENGVDIAHFPPVHGCGRASVELHDRKGIPFRFDLYTSYEGDGIGVPGRFVDVTSNWSYYGLGLFHSVSTADEFKTRVRQIYHFTPIPDDRVHLRVACSIDTDTVRSDLIDFVLRRNMEMIKANLDQDAPIWARKVYRENPVLSVSDGPLALLRRWSKQFYPTKTKHEMVAPERAKYELEVFPEVADVQAKRRTELTARPLDVTQDAIRQIFIEKIPNDFREGTAPRAFVVQYEVTGPASTTWYLEVDSARCTPVEGRHSAPEVTLKIDSADWLAMHAGRLTGAEAFMSGKLQIIGDFDLAMKLGEVFPLG